MNKIFNNKNKPYICTPLTGKTKTEIEDQLEQILSQKPDLIEWRADFLTDLADTDLVLHVIQQIKNATDIPLLFTIRSDKEGGEKITLSEEEKVQLISEVCKHSDVDIIDYETLNDEKYVRTLREVSKVNGKNLILSYHNFRLTPENREIEKIAVKAETYGADIAKFAVMPESQADVLRLLEVTKTIDDLLGIPVVTMSMGDIGGLSRIVGWAYGSIITFGVGVELSAPGQMPVKKLREAISLTQELVSSWE